MNLKLGIEETLELMGNYNLTTEEILVIELLFLSSAEEQHKVYLIKYLNLKSRSGDFIEILKSLQEKGIILKSYKIPKKGDKFEPENVDFNKNFLHNYRKFSYELGYEMFEAYPHFVNIKGVTYNIANFAKKFNSQEDFYFAYGKAIGWKLDKHKEVLANIEWAKKYTNFLNFNICDFVIARGWDRIDELKKNGDINMEYNFTETI